MSFLVAMMVIGCQQAPPPCDITEAKEAIRRADLDMAQAVAAHDRERFMTFIDPDGTFFGSRIARGPADVAAAWAPLLEPDGPTLGWQPSEVVVSGACDLGYSTGPYTGTRRAPDGSIEETTGTYVTIWKRSGAGAWRATIDIGTPPAPKKAEHDTQ